MRRAIREASLRRRHWRKAPDTEHRERAGRAVGTAKGQRPDGRRQERVWVHVAADRWLERLARPVLEAPGGLVSSLGGRDTL